MSNLLRLEFRRLFRAKSFYICLAVSLVMIVITALTTKMLLNLEEQKEVAEAMGEALQTPTSISMLKTAISSSLTTILAIFLSLFVAEDFTGDTIKNIYAKGNSRDSIYWSKYISSVVASIIMLFFCAIFSFATGKILFGEYGSMGKNYIVSLFAELVILLAYVTLYFVVAICIRKTGASLAISIIGPLLIGLFLTLGSAALKSDSIDLSSYWLAGRLSILEDADVSTKNTVLGFIIGGINLLVIGAAGFCINRSSER